MSGTTKRVSLQQSPVVLFARDSSQYSKRKVPFMDECMYLLFLRKTYIERTILSMAKSSKKWLFNHRVLVLTVVEFLLLFSSF